MLQILQCIVQYIDVAVNPSASINIDLLRVVARFVEVGGGGAVWLGGGVVV